MICEYDGHKYYMYLCIARHKLLVSNCIFGPQAIFEIASQGALDGEFKVLGCISLLIQSTKYSRQSWNPYASPIPASTSPEGLLPLPRVRCISCPPEQYATSR